MEKHSIAITKEIINSNQKQQLAYVPQVPTYNMSLFCGNNTYTPKIHPILKLKEHCIVVVAERELCSSWAEAVQPFVDASCAQVLSQ